MRQDLASSFDELVCLRFAHSTDCNKRLQTSEAAELEVQFVDHDLRMGVHLLGVHDDGLAGTEASLFHFFQVGCIDAKLCELVNGLERRLDLLILLCCFFGGLVDRSGACVILGSVSE
jgi:hypothetical protein